MRLFRTLILLTAAGLLLPSPPEDAGAGKAQADAVGTSGLLASATLAVVDAAGFCGRQPTVCQTAGYVAGRVEAKAKYSVKLIYEWANGPTAEKPAPALRGTVADTDPLKTDSTTAQPIRVAGGGQSTLRIEDLIPEWRGPQVKARG